MANPLYIIKDWDRNFENSESRKIKNLSWAPFPNRHDSAPFRRVAALKNSPEIFAAWVLIVQVASKMPVRGILQNSSGPLTAEDLHLMTGFPQKIFELAFEFLQKPGIQWILADFPESPDVLGNSPGVPGSFGVEGNRIEQNRIEGNGTEKGFARADVWFENPEFTRAWDGWEEMRKSSKAKPTDRARVLAFEKLKGLAGENLGLAVQIINASIESNWKTFYQLKGNNYGNGTSSEPKHRADKRSGEFEERLTL